MRKMMKSLIVGTLTGIMAVAMPFAASASEIDAEEEMVYEMDALCQDMSVEECMEALADFGMQLINDSEFCSDFAVTCLEADGVKLTEEEKTIIADIMNKITFDDVLEAVEEIDFDEVCQEFEKAFNKYLEECLVEEAAEIDAQLEALGQMLIDIDADDILAFLS